MPTGEQRNELVRRCHLLGHFQVGTTLKRLQDSYYWKNMDQDVKCIVGRCMTCQRHEKVPAVNHPALAIEVTGIHDRISVDLILGLPLTDEGYLGIITICESLSKRVEAYPIKSKAMGEISQHVWSYICRYGPPKECLSDQGNEWCNSMFKNMLSSLGVEHKVTSAYFARTNGQVERNNRTLMQSLRKHTEEHPTQWNKWLDFVVMAYNSRVHSSTNFTPHELCFGRKMNGFESWDTKPATDDVAALNQRALQIKIRIVVLKPSF